MKTLAEKIAVMQAALDGNKIECIEGINSNNTNGKWYPCKNSPEFNWSLEDYRIAEAPIVAPEGFELVAVDSKELPKIGWMSLCGSGWSNLAFDYESTPVCKSQFRFARPIVKRDPKMPDAPVFWVRSWVANSTACLVVAIEPVIGRIMWIAASELYQDKLIADLAFINWQWSADRKTWFNFYGEQVP